MIWIETEVIQKYSENISVCKAFQVKEGVEEKGGGGKGGEGRKGEGREGKGGGSLDVIALCNPLRPCKCHLNPQLPFIDGHKPRRQVRGGGKWRHSKDSNAAFSLGHEKEAFIETFFYE